MGTEAPYLLLEKGPGRPEGLGELLQVGEGDGVRPWLSKPAEATSELPLHSRLSGGGLALATSATRSPVEEDGIWPRGPLLSLAHPTFSLALNALSNVPLLTRACS